MNFHGAPDFTIAIVLTMEETPCSICHKEILPDKNPKHYTIGPVEAEDRLRLHFMCFEKLGWTIFYFMNHYTANEQDIGEVN